MCPSRLRKEGRAQGRERWEEQTLPRQSSHWTGQQTESQEFSHPLPPTPTQVEGEQLSPEPMLVKVSAQHRTDVSSEPEMTVTSVSGYLTVDTLTTLAEQNLPGQ